MHSEIVKEVIAVYSLLFSPSPPCFVRSLYHSIVTVSSLVTNLIINLNPKSHVLCVIVNPQSNVVGLTTKAGVGFNVLQCLPMVVPTTFIF